MAVAIGLALGASANAQVITDGSFGTPGTLAGPHYAIGASLGRQVGGNLFHSFSTFSLATGHSATFSGPASVANIVSRVTGSGASNIDGLIRSTIAGANLFLINPKGVVFGPNASLDLSGSFHAATADYVRLGAGGRFDASDPARDVLTSAPPEAFGFLGSAAAKLEVRGSVLEAATGAALSLVGPELVIEGALLRSRGGDIRLFGAPAGGESHIAAGPAAADTVLSGRISVRASSLIAQEDGTRAPGRIVIRGGVLRLLDTSISSTNPVAADAGAIDLQGYDVLLGRTTIGSEAAGAGAGAPVRLQAGNVIDAAIGSSLADSRDGYLAGGLRIESVSRGPGRGGDVLLSAPADSGRILLGSEASTVPFVRTSIGSAALGAGAGGDVAITAGEVRVSDADLHASSGSTGRSGSIAIFAGSLNLDAGEVLIRAAGDGAAGSIRLTATDAMSLGFDKLSLRSEAAGSGAGGSILLEAAEVYAFDTAIVSRATGAGAGGDIAINAADVTLDLTRIESSASAGGRAGAIAVAADTFFAGNGTRLVSTLGAGATGGAGAIGITAAEYLALTTEPNPTGEAAITSTTAGAAAGAAITLSAPMIDLGPGRAIESVARGTGAGGDIALTGETINLTAATIDSAADGAGRGGAIGMNAARISMLDGSAVVSTAARTVAGAGGAIALTAADAITLQAGATAGTPSLVLSAAPGSGAGGALVLRTAEVMLDGSFLRSTGDAGKVGAIDVGAASVVLDNAGAVQEAMRGSIRFDGTLGAALTLFGPNYAIEPGMGQALGANLFHSFESFGLLAGESATFNGPAGTRHIISRVTGSDASAIDGTLRTTVPGAQLYLINPHGFLFGAHVRFDLAGSLNLASADSLRLSGDGRFDAARPAETRLTTGVPLAFGFAREAPAPLAIARRLDPGDGNALTLAAGPMSLDGVVLATAGADLRLASVGGPGAIGLDPLATPAEGTAMGALALNGGMLASRDFAGMGPGRIIVRGADVHIAGAAIRSVNASAAPAQPILIAGESLTLSGALIESSSLAHGEGASLDLAATGSLAVSDGTFVAAGSRGRGRAGSISLVAPDIRLDGSQLFTFSLGGLSDAAAGGAGDVVLTGERIVLDNGASIGSGSSAGPAGRVSVRASESIDIVSGDISGTALAFGTGAELSLAAPTVRIWPEGFVLTDVTFSPGPARAGDIRIEAQRIGLAGFITATTQSSGAAGNIALTADAIVMPAGAIEASTSGTGPGGSITLRAASRAEIGHHSSPLVSAIFGPAFSVPDAEPEFPGDPAGRARIESTTRTSLLGDLPSGGPAGTIILSAPVLELGPRALVSARVENGTGAGGNVALDAGQLRVYGSRVDTSTTGPGPAGNIVLDAREAIEIARAEVRSDSFAAGASGDVTIRAPDVSLLDQARVRVGASAEGHGGAARIEGARIVLREGAGVISSTLAAGDAGSITLSASDSIVLGDAVPGAATTTALQAVTSSTGRGGGIVLQAPLVHVGFESSVSADTAGPARGGDVRIIAGQVQIAGGVSAAADSDGNAGSIDIAARDLHVRRHGARHGLISTDAFEAGAAGNIGIELTGTLLNEGFISAATVDGPGAGGNISIHAAAIDLRGGNISATTFGSGNAGAIALSAHDITVESSPGVGEGVLSNTSGSGHAGSIRIDAGRFALVNGGTVSTTAFSGAGGDAGTIVIAASDSIALSGRDALGYPSLVRSASFGEGRGGTVQLGAPSIALDAGIVQAQATGPGAGGSIVVRAGSLDLRSGGRFDASVEGSGAGGQIDVRAGAVSMRGVESAGPFAEYASRSTPSGMLSLTSGSGAGGNIRIEAPQTEIRDGAEVSASSTGSGTAGSIQFVARDALQLSGGAIRTEARSSDGGNVDIQAGNRVHLIGSDISTSAGAGEGSGGNITIDPVFVILQSSRIAANAFGGTGGNITIVADYFLASPDSTVEASSRLGVSGSVQIAAVRTDASSQLPALPAQFFDASGLLREACGGRWKPGSSRLVDAGRGGIAQSPFAYADSTYFPHAAAGAASGAYSGGAGLARRAGPEQGPGADTSARSVLLGGICGS